MEGIAEIGSALEEIVMETAALFENDVIVLTDVIELVSQALEVSVDWIRDVLKSSGSRLMHANNGIIGLIDGAPVTRNSQVYHVNKILGRFFGTIDMDELDYDQREYFFDLLATEFNNPRLKMEDSYEIVFTD